MQNPAVATVPKLADAQFKRISKRVYELCGIDLHGGKYQLVQARLAKRLRHLGLPDFESYLRYVDEDASGQELAAMIDVLTTNKTSFFREPDHFDFLRYHLLPCLERAGAVRMWSAGCSSGEEPLSMAMTLREAWGPSCIGKVRILGTDLSTAVLERAREGVYETESMADVTPAYLQKYFKPQTGTPKRWRADHSILSMVVFARLNLMSAWPMRGPFDAIFCRNVMIYFDKATQRRLIERFGRLLAPHGCLFIGHSESLSGMQHTWDYLRPGVYRRSMTDLNMAESPTAGRT